MQKFFVLLGLAVIAVACNQNKYGAFIVKGKLTNFTAGQQLYLEKIAYNAPTNTAIDSVKIGADGNYELKGSDKEQSLFDLSINHKPLIIFVNDNSTIEANVDLNNYHQPVFKNSPVSQKLYDFIGYYASKTSDLHSIEMQMDSLSKATQGDSLLHILQTHGQQEFMAMNGKIENVINTSEDPALICYAIDKGRSSIAPARLDTLAKNASARFKEHSGLAIIKSLLAQDLAQAQQQQLQQQQQSGGDGSTPAYPLLNQQAPDLSMNTVDGKPISISSFKGKYLLVDFWASWCGPCRGENPNVVKAYNEFKNKNFTILGVSLDQDKSAWVQAIKQDGLTWNHMSDLKYWQSAAVGTYQFEGIPFNVLIDPSGKIIASSLRGAALEQKLAEVLK